ncbi:MAG: MBL fold metallo-hydrolase [Phycisphaerales bacterium]|nr:MAG: MBL fold metallo-hydrolase [Phycisphaerales bacterium]
MADKPPIPDITSTTTQLVLLGTGTPNADPDRSGPAFAIVVNGTPYLVDCGPGIVRRAAAAHRNGVEGLAVAKLDRVFITHLHSDHTIGYPDLILTPAVLGRPGPLEAYGPPGLAKMTDHLLAAYDEDIRRRVDGFEEGNPEAYKVNVHEFEPGVIYEDGNVKVIAFPVPHAGWEHAFGFRFETPDRIIVISGDTTPCPELVEQARGCDILVHEVYSTAAFADRSPKWQKYHANAHTSSHQLAEIARQVRPGLLVLTHQLLWGTAEEELLAEIREIYDGEVRSGRDLDSF